MGVSALLTEDQRRAAVRSCRYCPMCHHADLTVTLQRRETYSARGRGLALFAAEQGTLHRDSEFAEVLYGFFADGLCQHVCAGHIPHDEMVIDARRQLVLAGQAPEAVARVKANIQKSGNPWGKDEPDLLSLVGAKAQRDVLVYFGPAARVQRPGVLSALTGLLKAAGVGFSVMRDEGDPGLLLYQLGEIEAGAQAAQALGRKIAASGARTVITPDADAYRTLKVGFGEATPLTTVKVQHTSELLANLVGGLKLRQRGGSRVAYHDPCALARLSPCLEAPRTVLKTVCDVAPLEIGTWSRDLANCSGECGGVPFVQPALSRKAAEHRVRAAREAGAELLVAGSPAAAAVLEGAGGMPVQELSEFLARLFDLS